MFQWENPVTNCVNVSKKHIGYTFVYFSNDDNIEVGIHTYHKPLICLGIWPVGKCPCKGGTSYSFFSYFLHEYCLHNYIYSTTWHSLICVVIMEYSLTGIHPYLYWNKNDYTSIVQSMSVWLVTNNIHIATLSHQALTGHLTCVMTDFGLQP